jgi:hypothetical protein
MSAGQNRGVEQIPRAVDPKTVRGIDIRRAARSALRERGQLMYDVAGFGRHDGCDKRIVIQGVCHSHGRAECLQLVPLARGARQRRHLVSSCDERFHERDADSA